MVMDTFYSREFTMNDSYALPVEIRIYHSFFIDPGKILVQLLVELESTCATTPQQLSSDNHTYGACAPAPLTGHMCRQETQKVDAVEDQTTCIVSLSPSGPPCGFFG